LSQYDRVRDLYTAQLFIGKLGSDRKRVIVSGMIWVTGADWR